jgi:putative PIN family toxin of toxin-antitoxin system
VRVVLNTNIIISTLVFQSGHLVWIRQAWTGRQITPLANKACVEELLRALTYPKFKLSPADIESLLGEYLPHVKTITGLPKAGKGLPRCEDPHDQKFLELAYTGNAEVLITGDKALLDLHKKTPFAILIPAEFRKLW